MILEGAQVKLKAIWTSLFSRLLLISLTTTVLVIVIVGIVMSHIENYHPGNVFSKVLIANILAEVPPQPQNLTKFINETGWQMLVSGPDFLWESAPDLETLANLQKNAPEKDFSYFWIKDTRWLVYRNADWNFYITAFKVHFDEVAKRTILIGFSVLLFVFGLSHLLVRWQFAPIRSLKSGADQIANGDLDFRVQTKRKDELGELTGSVNAMADRLRRHSEEKRQLLLAMGHELRTPLTRVKLLLEMFPDSDDRNQIGKNLDEINFLVATMLEAEALSGGFVALNKAPIQVAEFLTSCCEAFPEPIRIDSPAPLPEINLDQARMQIVLRNLLTNAFKYGGSEVELKAKKRDDVLQIAVIDDGQGIDASVIDQLGQPFFRPDSARSRKTGGYGLGLFLSRTIVESHGGTLTLTSQKGQGTTVTIELPYSC